MTFMAFRLFQLVISCTPQPAIEKTGQMVSRERFRRDTGQTGKKTGRLATLLYSASAVLSCILSKMRHT